jgi:hypothetical protein
MSDLDRLLSEFRRWLYLPDPSAVLAVLGTVAANRLDGDPVWLLLVGPPGSGKTEVLASVGSLHDVHRAATLTEAALLSGSPKRERAPDAKGGLLRTIGDFGLILCKDFGSVLSMNRDARAQVLAALREVYDGSWTRHVGTDGGRTLHWTGKVGLIGGCPPVIDRHHAIMGTMGERLALLRLPEVDEDEQARRALAHADQGDEMRSRLASAVEDFFERSPLPERTRELTQEERTALVSLATFTARARSAVERDTYHREIELVPRSEAPTRIVITLKCLLAGLEAIGAPREQARRVVAKVALDSIPAIRRSALNALYLAGSASTSEIAETLGYPTTMTRRALQDVAAHGLAVCTRTGQGKPDIWALTPFARARLDTVPETSEAFNSNPHRDQTDISGKVA